MDGVFGEDSLGFPRAKGVEGLEGLLDELLLLEVDSQNEDLRCLLASVRGLLRWLWSCLPLWLLAMVIRSQS